MDIAKIKIEVKVLSVYHCLDCGASAIGTTARYELESVEAFTRMLERGPAAHDMPYGWTSYLEGFRCPEHKK